MQIKAEQLKQQVSKALAPIYLITGDVELLANEARDSLRVSLKKQGFDQREVLSIDPKFKWNQLTQLTRSMSLFSEKTCIEIRNPSAKFDKVGTEAIKAYLADAPEDKVVLMLTGKLTVAQKKTKWYQAIDQAGVIVTLWPISRNELPRWIDHRFQKTGLSPTPDAAQLLADLTEGNLLATHQAIEKCCLLFPKQSIGIHEITQATSDSARFTIFDLMNHAMSGQSKRTQRVLNGLRFEGVEPVLILWAIARELRDLYSLSLQINKGVPMDQVLAKQWQMRKPLLQAALNRLTCHQINQLQQTAAQIDLIIKGATIGNSWDALSQLCFRVSQ